MRKFALFLLTSILIYTSFLTLEHSEHAVSENQYKDPVLFIHGFKGTARSFDTMIARFEQRGWGSRALTVKVTRNGRLLIHEKTVLPDKPAFIQVLFENNRASFEDTAHSLAAVMQALKKEYGIEQVSIIGHSMGGIVSVKFLQDLYNPELHPATGKLVTIGSPFDGIAGSWWFDQNDGPAAYDLMTGSPALVQIALRHNHFPAGTKVLNLAGTGDQVTTLQSALSLKAIVPKPQYEADVIFDHSISHSGLHETVLVDQKIGAFFSYK